MDRNLAMFVVCFSIVMITLFGSVSYVKVSNQKAMTEMVGKGANPIAVYCALDGINVSNQGVCQAAATQPLSKSLEK